MTLEPSTRVGPYEIFAHLGSGGMGEVYRARDSKLARDIALKVLPAAFMKDANRLSRFRREAQVLASLNHPNVAADTLTDRIARGAIPPDRVLPIARQMCDGLEAAELTFATCTT